MAGQEIDGALGVLFVGEQGVTHLDLDDARRAAVALDPGPSRLLNLPELTGVEVVEAVEVVIIFGTGDELLERFGAVLRQGEFLDVADLAGACAGNQEHGGGECRQQARAEPIDSALHRQSSCAQKSAARARSVKDWNPATPKTNENAHWLPSRPKIELGDSRRDA